MRQITGCRPQAVGCRPQAVVAGYRLQVTGRWLQPAEPEFMPAPPCVTAALAIKHPYIIVTHIAVHAPTREK